MAGIRSDAVARASGSARVVRAMPNTPALIGRGIAGLFAREAVSAAERAEAESIVRAHRRHAVGGAGRAISTR